MSSHTSLEGDTLLQSKETNKKQTTSVPFVSALLNSEIKEKENNLCFLCFAEKELKLSQTLYGNVFYLVPGEKRYSVSKLSLFQVVSSYIVAY